MKLVKFNLMPSAPLVMALVPIIWVALIPREARAASSSLLMPTNSMFSERPIDFNPSSLWMSWKLTSPSGVETDNSFSALLPTGTVIGSPEVMSSSPVEETSGRFLLSKSRTTSCELSDMLSSRLTFMENAPSASDSSPIEKLRW